MINENRISEFAKVSFEEAATKQNIPGLSYGVTYQGRVIASGNFGVIDPFNQVSASDRSVYPMASMSKSFAGAAILILRDRNLLKINDLVSKYIPELQSDVRWNEITIYDLITMNSGLPEDDPWADRQVNCSDLEFTEIYKRGVSGEFVFCKPKATVHCYSNLSYMMLGRVISKASNEHALSFIEKNIFKPLGLDSTYWRPEKDKISDFAIGVDANGSLVPTPICIGDGAVFGGVLSTVRDILVWVGFLMSRENKDYDKILGQRSRIELRSGGRVYEEIDNLHGVTSYAYGLIGSFIPEVELIRFGHSGGLPGFGSRMSFIPEYQLGVVALANQTYAPMSVVTNNFIDSIVPLLKKPEYEQTSLIEERSIELCSLIREWNDTAAENIFASNFFLDNNRSDIKLKFQVLNERIDSRILVLETGKYLEANILLNGTKILTFSLAPVEFGKIQAVEILAQTTL